MIMYPTSYTEENEKETFSYPSSFTSITSDGAVNRSRRWSDDITKNWTSTITGLETFYERTQRYLVYFKLTTSQLTCIRDKLVAEMQLGLDVFSEDFSAPWDMSKCSIKMLDTYLDESMLSKIDKKRTGYAIALSGGDATSIKLSKIQFEGSGKFSTTTISANLNDAETNLSKGLLDASATAKMLFNYLAETATRFINSNNPSVDKPAPVTFVVGFPTNHKSLSRAALIRWCKLFETGRKTKDSVEGMDLDGLLNCAFQRKNVNAKVTAIVNATTAHFIYSAYQKSNVQPECKLAFSINEGLHGCYIQPDAQTKYGFHGNLINCEIASFDKSLPVNDVDVEVDYADETSKGYQLFEKLISTIYIEEICRRLIIKIWQSEASQLTWVRNSIPWIACARIVEDNDSDLTITDEILFGLWKWETSVDQRRAVQQLFQGVFERSAALAAVAIVATASQTGLLQPALNGVSCSIDSPLYTNCPFYSKCLKESIKQMLPSGTENCIQLIDAQDSSAHGGAIVSCMQ